MALGAAGSQKAPLLLGRGKGAGGAGGGDTAGVEGVVLGGLEPYTAYTYRLVAHNALGESSGASTGPLLTDAVGTRIGEPPAVRALGSASFFVEWAR